MAGLALVSDQIQHRVRNIGPYTAWCLGLSLFVTVCAGLISPLVWQLFGLACLVQVSALYKGRTGRYYVFAPSPGHLFFPACVYFIGIFAERRDLKTLAVCGEILMILLNLSWRNQKSLERTYVDASERTRVPYRKIGLLNGGLLGIYLLLAGLICLVLTSVYSGDDFLLALPLLVFRLAAMIFFAIIRFLSLLFPSLGDGGTSASGDGSLLLPEGRELFPWIHLVWFVLEKIFGVIFLMLGGSGNGRYQKKDPDPGKDQKSLEKQAVPAGFFSQRQDPQRVQKIHLKTARSRQDRKEPYPFPAGRGRGRQTGPPPGGLEDHPQDL